MIFKICRTDERKNYFSTIAFLTFSHLQNFQEIGIDAHPIDLIWKKKIPWPEAEISVREVGNMEKVRVD